MVLITNQYYRSSSLDYLEGDHTKDFEPLVDTDKVFYPILALNTTRTLRIWNMGTFNDMKDNHCDIVRDQFLGCAGGISLHDWKLYFYTWMKKKCEGLPSFDNSYVFELLPKHLEYKLL